VSTHLEDLSTSNAHELTDRDIQSATGVFGRTSSEFHDVLSSNRYVQDLRSERVPAERAKLRQKVIADRGPAAMCAGNPTGTGKMPNGFLVETFSSGVEIPGRQGCKETPDHRHISRCRH